MNEPQLNYEQQHDSTPVTTKRALNDNDEFSTVGANKSKKIA
jgi:hypothetical protein